MAAPIEKNRNISAFNERYWNGDKPDAYVGLNEMERAARALVEEESNMAFEQHWADAGPPERRLLAALAWATDERDRPGLDMDGMAAATRETKLELPRAELAAIIERLSEEEVLEAAGLTYRFAGPLYRPLDCLEISAAAGAHGDSSIGARMRWPCISGDLRLISQGRQIG